MTTEELIEILKQHPGKRIGWSCNNEYGPGPIDADCFQPDRMAVAEDGGFDYPFRDNEGAVQDVLMICIME
jgi:hypothetical protein